MARSADLIGLCATVPLGQAHQALRDLGAKGLRDPRRAPRRAGGSLLIPLAAEALGHELDWPVAPAETPLNPRAAPQLAITDELSRLLPDELRGEIPVRWQRIGDVILLRLGPAAADHERAIGRVVGQTLGARSVLARYGTQGELREPVVRHLWGDPDTRTVHREAGLTFSVDPARVLFSAGNVHERHRLVGAVGVGETIVDLFAGVGYFSLPLARAGATVIACEKNPVSAELLRTNVEVNGLSDEVSVLEGDCRDTAPRGVADRVVMGYFPGTEAFLPTALAALDGGGLVHVHVTASAAVTPMARADELVAHSAFADRTVRVVNARRVKWYAPSVQHMVADLEVCP